MAVVVATRTKMHRARFLPKFLVANVRVAWQARRTPGFLGGRLRVEQGGAFWTLTAWQSGRDMIGVWNTAESIVPHCDEASRHVATNRYSHSGTVDHSRASNTKPVVPQRDS